MGKTGGLTWTPPEGWVTITTIDAHAAGEPLRIITGGLPPIPGSRILEKRMFVMKNFDWIRTVLMWEPRGHADMYGCIVTEAISREGSLGVIFLHNEGYSTMCGHGIIALTTTLVETDLIDGIKNKDRIGIDTPAGLVRAFVRWEGGKARSVSFENVPSFVFLLDGKVPVPGIGEVSFDIAYGGAFYAFCRADSFGLRLVPEEFARIIDIGMRIKKAVMERYDIRHPHEKDLGFLYGTIFTGGPHDRKNHSRNVCVFAEGELDRSPTGTGVSARAALHHARGELMEGECFSVESILGTVFSTRIVGKTAFGPHPAVIPEVTGSAHITGIHQFLLDPDDPLKEGFFLR